MAAAVRIAAAALAAGAVLGLSVPALAAEPRVPGQPEVPYRHWWYPPQLPGGTLEDGTSPARPAPDGFLTLPFIGPHYVTAIFDHCGPDYVPDGRVCRWDGLTKQAGGFGEDGPPSQEWLYYDGHDGLDYGLYFEDVLAAADGVVTYADWNVPGCPTCGFGLEVRIDHGNGITTRYAHLSQAHVHRGQRVRRGQVVGLSGSSGAGTGEHLHFGVYLTGGFVPVDPYGWAGPGVDPWPRDVGNLWQGGAPRFPPIKLPRVEVSVKPATGSRLVVDWSAAGGGSYDLQVVEDGQLGRPWLSGAGPGSATFEGRPGHSYWFLVTYHDDLGFSALGASDTVSLGGDLAG